MIQNKPYIKSLDLLRGLAAISVCIYHFTNGNTRFLPDGNVIKIIGSFGSYGVQVFFVISGLVIPYSMDVSNYKFTNLKTFLFKRIIRVEPPYIINIVFTLLLLYLSTLSSHYRGPLFKIDFVGLGYHIGYLNAFFNKGWINPVYWTLAIEFQYYILLALIFPLLRTKYWILVLLIFNLPGLYYNFPQFIFQYALYFSVGIIIYKFHVKNITIINFWLAIAIILIVIFIQFGTGGLVAAVIPVLFQFISINNYFAKFLGNISYSLYLIHVPFGMKIINLSENFIKKLELRYVSIGFAIIASCIVAYVFYIIIERPFKVISHNLKYQEKSSKINVARTAN